MSDTTQHSSDASSSEQPPLVVLGQYIKDFSFEVPDGPAIFAKQTRAPDIAVSLDVVVNHLGDDDFEVALPCELKAVADDETAFVLELVYCGIVRIKPTDASHAQILLYVETPRLLFPFVRKLIASTTGEGGFPSFVMHPIDFVELFRKRVEALKAQQRANVEAPPSTTLQ